MKKFIVILIVLVAVGAGAGAYYMRRTGPEPQVSTMPLSRGDVVDTVGATGTLGAVETVDVGTQVSGTVQELYADFNSIVKKGQVIARLDPSLIQTQIEQQRANVIRSEADVERLKVGLADAKQKLERAKAMWDRQLIPRTELETAEVNVKSAEAQIRSSEAALTQAKANLNQQEVNLDHTIITAPIDGIVISRNVDVGQTVAASMSAPTLFILAADLTKMQVLANIDEADVGRMRPGQAVRFRVDAYPTDEFIGAVEQVRLQPAVVQNVVTYSTVIAVPNPELKLKPGMTANVSIEIARRTNVLRIPNAALRFRPTEEMFTVLNQEVPPEILRGRGGVSGMGGRGGRNGRSGQAASGQPGQGAPASGAPGGSQAPTTSTQPAPAGAPAATPGAPAARAAAAPPSGTGTPQGAAAGQQARSERAGSPEGRGGGDRPEGGFGGGRGGFDPNMSPEERRKRMEERLASMTPEERERFEARMRERQAQGGQGIAGQGSGRGGDARPADQTGRRDPSRGITAGISPGATHQTGATTIDALFGPLPTVETRGRAWLYLDKKLKPVSLRLGVSDGTYTEVLSGDLQPNQEVVISMVTGLEPQRPATTSGGQNPLMGPQRGGPPGGGRGR